MDHASNYDTVPYPDFVHPRTNPDSIAAMARLYGFSGVDPASARVLELGCGQGGNLISIASLSPHSRCLGIDLNRGQIASGESRIEQLGFTNIRLHAGDICDFPKIASDQNSQNSSRETWGMSDGAIFDYIIVHGVYSWVPDAVRQQLLRIASEHLSRSGIAFFSYNTYPGWHAKGMVREMLRHHVERTKRVSDSQSDSDSLETVPLETVPLETVPLERLTLESIAEAKRFLADVANSVPESTGYGRILREEYRSISQSKDAYLFHEQFEAVNQPRYFHQFIGEIQAAGLRYLGEASLTFLPSQTEAMRQRLADMPMLQREQYIDYLGNRSFRQSLICRNDCDSMSFESPASAAIETLWLSSDATCTRGDGQPLRTGEEGLEVVSGLRVTNSDGASAVLNNPATQTAIAHLVSIGPANESFDDVWRRVQQSLSSSALSAADLHAERVTLREELLQLAYVGMVRFHVGRLPLVTTVSSRPMATSLARWQAETSDMVTSQRHIAIRLDPPARYLITLCTGRNDFAAIHEAMLRFVSRDGVSLQHDGNPVTDPELLRELVRQKIGPNLQHLAKLGFLIQ